MEWTVVTVIIALAGLLAAVTKPLLALNTAVTRLTGSVETLEKNIKGLADKNDEAHEKLWEKCRSTDTAVNGHETRLKLMESR